MAGNWQEALKRFRAKANNGPLAVMRETVREMGDVAIDTTPVLSGHLVSNWRLSLSSPNDVEETGFGPVRGVARQRLQVALRGAGAKQRWYFTNPTSYAAYVNYGTSRTQPRLMVEIALAAFPRAFQDAMRKVQREMR